MSAIISQEPRHGNNKRNCYKSNRKIALTLDDKQKKHFVSVDSLTWNDAACATGLTIYLEQLDFPRLLLRSAVTNDRGCPSVLHLVTSDLTLSGSQMVILYQKRWKIEEFHKSIKSHASFARSPTRFARSPTRRVRTQSNHFFASLVAFGKLESYWVGLSLSHRAGRGQVYQAALSRAFEQLQVFKKACPTATITP